MYPTLYLISTHHITCLFSIFRSIGSNKNNNVYSAQSVRRTSLRDKSLTTKKDAVEEARLRLRAQEVSDLFEFYIFLFSKNTLISTVMLRIGGRHELLKNRSTRLHS